MSDMLEQRRQAFQDAAAAPPPDPTDTLVREVRALRRSLWWAIPFGVTAGLVAGTGVLSLLQTLR